MARWVVPLLGAVLLIPSANVQTFDGLPLSTLPEFAALALLAPLVASRALRRLHARWLHRLGAWVAPGLGAGLAAALGLKVILLAAGVHAGFLACYQTPLGPPPGGGCERSFANPFARFGATRIDRHVAFEPATWNLSFLNSNRFNFYPWVAGQPRRDRLPLIGTWRGTVERSEPWVARVTYVGEVALTRGPDTHVLPAQYGPPRTVELPVPAGRQDIVVAYRFDDGTRTGQPDPPWSYGQLRLARTRHQGGEALVETVRPRWPWRVAAVVSDGLLGVALASLVALYARLLAPTWWLLGLVAGGTTAAAPDGLAPLGLSPEGLAWLLLALIVLVLAVRPRPRLLVASYVAIVVLSLAAARRSVPGFRTVLPRSAGNDWLTYESHARTILETWSLQGGEDVFHYSPLFRYVRFLQRLLLGDGDLLVLAGGLAALYLALLWTVARLRTRRTPALGVAGLTAAALLLLTLTTSSRAMAAVLQPLSEPPTWTALLVLFPLLFAARTARAWLVGAALAGLAAGIRPNQAPALAFLVGVFLMAAPRARRGAALAAVAVFLAAAALPLAHNLYYGGRAVPFTTSGGVPENLTLPPRRLLGIGADPAIRAQVRAQLTWLAVPSASSDAALPIALHGLQAAWLLAAVTTAMRWRRVEGPTRLLLLWPAVFLGVHVVFDASTYYPRHVVAGYVAMGLVAAYVASGRGARDAPAVREPRTRW